ncbi:MAG TPA: hypothetical protein VGG45_12430 [Terracidiphilus sp.]|jgi:TctA family transporter
MYWLGFVVLVLVIAFVRYQKAQRAGLWSWSKFFLTLGFLGVVCLVVSLPLMLMNMKSPFFWPVYGAGWAVAVGMFVWFILQARKWKLPDGRTALKADRDQQPPQ